MKKSILFALVALIVSAIPASAIDVKSVSSNITGFSCVVPEDAAFMKNDYEAVILATADQEFLVSAVPFQPSKLTDEENYTALKALVDNANIDLEQALEVNLTNELMSGGVFMQTMENGAFSCVGIMKVDEGDLAFYVAVILSPNYTSIGDTVLKSLDFDPDAVQ